MLALRTGRADPGDALYTAAFQRAGMVRVDALDDLLDEIETLGVGRVTARGAATLVTSDAGVAKLAVDAVAEVRDVLTDWSPAATSAVSAALPHLASPGNPLTLGDDARPSISPRRSRRSHRSRKRARCSSSIRLPTARRPTRLRIR